MFRHDLRHSGVSPYHDASPTGTFWKYNTGSALGSPVIGPGGTIYIPASSWLYALNGNGTLKWKCWIGSSTRSTPAIADDGVIYVGSNDYKLYAINPDGTQAWSFPTGGKVTSSPAIAPDGTVYVGSWDGNLYAVNPDGTEKWSCAVGGVVDISSPAVGSDGTVYIGSHDDNIYAINPDGTEKWHYTTGGQVLTSPAISPDGSTIYASSYDSYLYAISSSGTLQWRFPLVLQFGNTASSPAVAPDGTIYIGSNAGTLHAVNPSGTEIWRFETSSDIRSSPAVSADGTIYFGCWDGYVYALNPDGTEKWHLLTKGSIYSSPAIAADGTVVINSWDGYTYGNLNSTPPPTVPPSDLTAAVLSDTQARLNWQDNSPDEFGFRIERKLVPGGTYAHVANVGPNVTTYDDADGLSSGLTYYYRVCAYQEGGNSPYSNEAPVTMPGLAAPSDLVATAISGTRIDLQWTDWSANELGFKIQRMTGPSGFCRQIAVVPADTVAYSDTSVNPATVYYYRVCSFDATGDSTWSNTAWAVTDGMDFTEISRGNLSRKQMALTFDAGDLPVRSGLLDVLRDRQVYCTFFPTGRVAEQLPWDLIQIATDGHVIGNHSYSHPDFTSITDAEIIEQLSQADEILYNLTGHHTRPYFRVPYGFKDAHVLSVAESIGFRHVFWTVYSCDLCGWTVQQIIDTTLNNAGNGVVMLYHCKAENTEIAMPTIIDALRAQGYELVTVPEIVAPKVVSSPPGTINTGWNLISIPIEPATPNPPVVFRGIDIDGTLYRWDKETASVVAYDAWNPGGFGQLSADEGYWLRVDAPTTIKCAGAEVTNDRHIKLPQALPHPTGAWTMIGYPFETAQEWSNCRIHNPNAPEPKTRSVTEAKAAGWISSMLWSWDSSTQSVVDVGLPEDWPMSTQIEPWHGYWMRPFVNGLELIIPKP